MSHLLNRVWTKTRESVAIYGRRDILIVGALGFASGLPLLLTLSTLSVWLVQSGVDRTTVGLFALAGVPYSFKFAWAPLIDRVRLPILAARVGHRRSWGILSQLALATAIVALGMSDPAASAAMCALAAVAVSFFSATQDIVVDAYRVELLDDEDQGAGAAIAVLGYRLGMMASGAGALFLVTALPWPMVFAAMAALLVLVGSGAFWLGREPEGYVEDESAETAAPTGALAWMREAVLAPLSELLRRPGAIAIVAFVLLYKVGDALASVMSMPLYLELGFSEAEIAGVTKVFGLVAVLVGGLLGGAILTRIGVLRGLLVFGVLQLVSNFGFGLLAMVGHDNSALAAVVALENLASGMGAAALVAYLATLCNAKFTATQFALLTSLTSVGRTVLASGGGWLADQVSWVGYFSLTAVAALPGLVVLLWIMRRPTQTPRVATLHVPALGQS